MRVELKSIKDNPFRNFKVDPIDPAVVESLKENIKDNPAGFWGGIVARRTKNDGIQLAFGHHRVRAAIAAGIREDDIRVSDIPDAEMIRMYANENATQRGNSGTSLAGSIASAVRFLAKGLLTGNLSGFPDTSTKARETLMEQLGTERGIGEPIITAFLDHIRGVNENTVKQQLANLKASGDYDSIIESVRDEIEEENKEALKAMRRQEEEQRKATEAKFLADQRAKEAEERRKEAAKAERAAKEEAAIKRAAKEAADAEAAAKRAEEDAKLAAKNKAEADAKAKEYDALRQTSEAANKAAGIEREITFDFEGVAKHLKNPSHVDVFRKMVTGPGVKPYLPVNRQAALAKQLVNSIDANELSGRHIRENLMSMVMAVKHTERKFSAEEKAELIRKDWSAKASVYQDDFARNARGLLAAAMLLSSHARNRPKGVTLHQTSEFRDAVRKVEKGINILKQAGL